LSLQIAPSGAFSQDLERHPSREFPVPGAIDDRGGSFSQPRSNLIATNLGLPFGSSALFLEQAKEVVGFKKAVLEKSLAQREGPLLLPGPFLKAAGFLASILERSHPEADLPRLSGCSLSQAAGQRMGPGATGDPGE
jgi:hypothetical protein